MMTLLGKLHPWAYSVWVTCTVYTCMGLEDDQWPGDQLEGMFGK